MTAKEKALSLVGQGYIYGAKGQTCSLAFRQQQAQQYPRQADNILVTGAKWDGLPVWDCAQLTRAVAREMGVEMVSGATSQWNKTAWARQGTIDTLPEEETVFVFREGDGCMQHTGVSLGDGTCVHAKGTKYGVVRESIEGCEWTHWGALFQQQEETPARARVWALTGSTVNVRAAPGGRVIARLPIGTEVTVYGHSAGWSVIDYEGQRAYMQSGFLQDLTLDDLIRRVNEIEARLDKAGL